MVQSRTFKAATLGSGQFLAQFVLLITAAVLSRVLAKTDYAAYRQTLLVYTFLSPLLALGFPQALNYFLPRDKTHARSILSGNLLILMSTGLLFFIFLWSGGNRFLAKAFDNPDLSELLLIYSPYALLALPVLSMSACLVSYDRVKMLAVYNVLSKSVFLILVVGLTLIWRTPEAAVYGAVIAALIVFPPSMFLMYRVIDRGDWRFSWIDLREQIKYSVPLGLSMMIGIIAINLDKVIVSSTSSPDQFAIYVNGAIEVPLVGIITGSVMAILLPEFSALYKEKNTEKIVYLWHGAMVKCALIIFPVMIFLLITAPEVMRVIFSAKYSESAVPFRIYLLLLPVRITQFGAILMAAGKSRLILLRSSIGLFINLVLSVILVKLIGYIGAAIGTVASIYLWSTPFNLKCVKQVMKESFKRYFPYGDLFKILACSLIAAMPVAYLTCAADLADIALLGIETFIYGAFLLGLFHLCGYINIPVLIQRMAKK